MAVSLREIAKLAGVSPATVSLALGGHPRISESRRLQIEKLAAELGYRPNLLAKGLQGNSTNSIGVLWYLAGPHSSEEMVRRIAIQAQARGYACYISDHVGNPLLRKKCLEDFLSRKVEAVVLEIGDSLDNRADLKGGLGELLKEFRSCVLVSPSRLSDTPRLDWVVRDRLGAFQDVARYFYRSGRRRPCVITYDVINRPKADAFLWRAAELGMRVDGGALIEVKRECGELLLSLFPAALDRLYAARGGSFPFDCIVCMNDEAALVTMSWLRRKGLRVPEDVAVAGMNNSSVSPYLDPPLASIDRRKEDAVEAIAEAVFDRLENPGGEARVLEVPMRFVWRESAGGTSPVAAALADSASGSAELFADNCEEKELHQCAK